MAHTELASSFNGRIAASDTDPAVFQNVRGHHITMYPASQQDVEIAVQLCRQSYRDIIVCSGRNNVSTDQVDAEGAVVLNMEALSSIDVQDSRIIVGPAVTMKDLAHVAYNNGLFLPVTDNLIKSVASAVLSDELGMVTRRAGSIASYLTEITVVTYDGMSVVTKKGDDLFNAVLASNGQAIISNLTFEALEQAQAQRFWMSLFYLPFRKDSLQKILKATIDPDKIPTAVDVCIKVTHIAYGLPIIRVSIAGTSDCSGRDAILQYVEHTVSSDDLDLMDGEAPRNIFVGKDIIRATMESGKYGGFSHGYVSTKHLQLVRSEHFHRFVDPYCDIINAAAGATENGEVYLPKVWVESQVCLNTDNHVNINAYLFVPPDGMRTRTAEQEKISELKRIFSRIIPVDMSPPSRRVLRDAVTATGFSDQDSLPTSILLDPTSLGSIFAEDPSKLIQRFQPEHIPGFKGEIFMEDDPLYTEKTKQYATSSYDPELMSPYMITYPVDVQDVQLAIAFRIKNGKKVVARSGGHQYSGMSSGGKDTIVLSMNMFNNLTVHGKQATVGVGLLLEDIAAKFKEHGITVPHGECPKVGIGGHIQTGGYGHLLRGFGLIIDFVHSFDIVLADGTFMTISRPQADGSNAKSLESRIFWGVLGGGPNSFGIVTEITFDCIQDETHPFSRGLKCKTFYKKNSFFDVMKEVQRWTVELKKEHSNYLLADLDLMVTAISTDLEIGNVIPFLRSALSVEVVYGNRRGTLEDPQEVEKAQQVIKDIRLMVDSFFLFIDFKEDEHKTLSFMSDSFVRRKETTPDGREFPYPYVKRLNATYHPLSDGFIREFVDIVDESINSTEVRAVFQMGLGGGQHSGHENRPLTSCSHRDLAFGMVYDVFYKEGKKEIAEEFQRRMKDTLEREFKGEGESVRMLWGSYGETDMNVVWKNYYDNKSLYEQLQSIKSEVDGMDVFHTEFTVQLP